MDTYLLHQTPRSLAHDLITRTPLAENDRVLEPFKGEGAFYDAFPSFVQKEWCEATAGRDYTSFEGTTDWVISNPPYRIDVGDKLINALWLLLSHFSTRATKGIAFLVNDKCLSTLTPRRLETLAERGFHMTNLIVCSVKKWRGRYYYLIFQKGVASPSFQHLLTNYE